MRIGAIFARGSTALKWMALAGVVFALGAASAAAQVTIKGPTMNTVAEGETAVYTVTVKGYVVPGASADAVEVTVTLTPAAEGDATEGETQDYSTNLGLTLSIDVPAGPAVAAGVVGPSFNSSGSIRVPVTQDNDAEDERFTLGWTVDVGGLVTAAVESGGTPIVEATGSPTALIIDDDEEQEYVLALMPATQKPSEGDPVTVRLSAKPEHTDQGSGLITLHLDQTPPYSIAIVGQGQDGTGTDAITGSAVTIGGASGQHATAQITVTTDPNDENRTDDTITLTAYSGTAGNSEIEDTIEITLADDHKLPVGLTATAIVLGDDDKPLDPQPDMVDSIMEGETIHLMLTSVDKDGKEQKFAEELSVMLTPTGDANAQDYRLATHPVKIAADGGSATVALTASMDQDVGMEMLVLDATVSGDAKNGKETVTTMGVLSLAIMDATMKSVEAVSDEMIQEIVYAAKEMGAGDDMMFSPGEMIEIDASMLFMPADGYGLTYSAMADNDMAVDVSVMGNMVMVMGMEPAMDVHVTITATATSMMSGAKARPQTTPNVAQVIFPLDVELADLMVTLEVDDMNLVEGGMPAMITAMANRPVAEDTMVELIQTDGTASPSDYEVENIMIMAGEMMGTTMIMAMDDEMMENDMNMAETLTIEGRIGAMSTNSVSFYIWDASVPALPIIAQLLLAAFLAIGGYRRYLRR